jgi:hypothetical protein
MGARATTAQDVAHTAYEFARHDAQGFGGVTTYGLVAYAEGAESYGERCTFRIAAAMVNDMAPSESPTSAGLALQGMRHLEVMAFQYSEGMRNVLREKDLTILDLRTENSKLREERTMLIDSQMRVVKMREELSSEETQRQLLIDRERASLAAREKLHATFFSLAVPILSKKLAEWRGAAPEALPAPASPIPAAVAETPAARSVAAPAATSAVANDTSRLSAAACERVVDFVTSLDETTFGRMMGVLSEDQGSKLVALAAQLHADMTRAST